MNEPDVTYEHIFTFSLPDGRTARWYCIVLELPEEFSYVIGSDFLATEFGPQDGFHRRMESVSSAGRKMFFRALDLSNWRLAGDPLADVIAMRDEAMENIGLSPLTNALDTWRTYNEFVRRYLQQTSVLPRDLLSTWNPNASSGSLISKYGVLFQRTEFGDANQTRFL